MGILARSWSKGNRPGRRITPSRCRGDAVDLAPVEAEARSEARTRRPTQSVNSGSPCIPWRERTSISTARSLKTSLGWRRLSLPCLPGAHRMDARRAHARDQGGRLSLVRRGGHSVSEGGGRLPGSCRQPVAHGGGTPPGADEGRGPERRRRRHGPRRRMEESPGPEDPPRWQGLPGQDAGRPGGWSRSDRAGGLVSGFRIRVPYNDLVRLSPEGFRAGHLVSLPGDLLAQSDDFCVPVPLNDQG